VERQESWQESREQTNNRLRAMKPHVPLTQPSPQGEGRIVAAAVRGPNARKKTSRLSTNLWASTTEWPPLPYPSPRPRRTGLQEEREKDARQFFTVSDPL